MDTQPIDSALFSRYAERDLNRWRQLIGQDVVHVDPRWGIGRVENVRWGSPFDHVAPYVQVRVRYVSQGGVVFRASSFDAHHCSVAVSSELRCLLRVCFEEERDEVERASILERHDAALCEARDRKQLERAQELRRLAADRNASGI